MGITTYPVQAPKTYVTAQLTASGTWSVPATTTQVDVIVIGGGSGGDGIATGSGASANVAGNAGAPGCYMYVPNYPVTPSSTVSYTIGTGGAGGVGSGTTAATFAGSVGGNTTFGGLVAPGAGVKIGSRGGSTTVRYRGGFGIYGAGLGVDFGNNYLGNFSTATWATLDPNILGFPFGVPGAVVHYTDFNGNNASNIVSSIYPSQLPGGNVASDYEISYIGIGKTFNRILNDFTAPTGTAGGAYAGNTAGATPSGWNGAGGSGSGSSTSGQTGVLSGYGGGGGGVVGGNVNSAQPGGIAATNSGAGGGGAHGRCASAGMANSTANGGAGGSGVIFLGYWA
jgi:hypothetical protein